MRPLGLRGAVEIASLMRALGSQDDEKRREAKATLADLTNALQPPHTEATLRYTFTQIADNPYTHFLIAVAINSFEPVTSEVTQESGSWRSKRAGIESAHQNGHAEYPHCRVERILKRISKAAKL